MEQQPPMRQDFYNGGNMTEPATLGPWKGMDNRHLSHALGADTLRDAKNVVLDNSGRAASRAGVTLAYAGTDLHSLFSCPAGVYFVESGTIKKLADNYATAISIKSGVGNPVAWQYFNGVVYWSDGASVGAISDTVALSWGVPVPDAPVLTVTSGSLAAGSYSVYLVAASALSLSLGEESGCSSVVKVDVPENGGITVHAPGLGTTYGRVYCTTTDGEAFYYAGACVSGGSLTITSMNGDTFSQGPQFCQPPLPGSQVRIHGGRAYVVSGNVVYFSDHHALGRFRPRSHFIQYPGAVTLFEPTDAGFWIGSAETTHFLAGRDPFELSWDHKLNYGAKPGTAVNIPNSNNIAWMSQRGLCIGTEDGQVTNVQEAMIAVNPSEDTGASVIAEMSGTRLAIATFNPSSTSIFADIEWVADQ